MRHRYAWILPVCFLLVCGFAQQNAGGRRMTLDVVVTDKSGKPVTGLQQQDFTVLDNKKPANIAAFSAVERGGVKSDPPVQVILVIDAVNITASSTASARDQIEKFLKRDNGELALPVSLAFLNDNGATMEKGATRDGNALVAALNQSQFGLRSINRSQGIYGAGERLQLCVRALQGLIQQEVGEPGRKLAIWISPGWPLISGPNQMLTAKQQQSLFDIATGISGALQQARMTLYDVDPLGVADAGGFRTIEWKEFLKPLRKPSDAQNGDLALQVFVSQSGGQVLNSGNDIAAEIAKCIADAGAFYTVTFDLPASTGPNQFHALDVKVGKPGLTARTRTGYYTGE